MRSAVETLRRRQARFRRELGDGEATLSLAMDGEEAVGFAMVRLREGEATFDTGEVVAELETMAVAPARRGRASGPPSCAMSSDDWPTREWGSCP